MRFNRYAIIGSVIGLVIIGAGVWTLIPRDEARKPIEQKTQVTENLAAKGRDIFRNDTYGDEYYFIDELKLPFKTLLAAPAATREKTLGS